MRNLLSKPCGGPKLTTDEVAKAKERAPLDRNGQLLCWSHLTHVGCSNTSCQRSHEGLRGSFESLDPHVQMQLLKRGGLKRMKLETKDSVATKIKDLRSKLERDKSEKIQDGKRRGQRAGQSDEAQKKGPEEGKPTDDPKAGGSEDPRRVRFWEPPEEFQVDYTKEEDLKELIKKPEDTWGETVKTDAKPNPGRQGESAPQEARRLVAEAQRLGRHETLKKLEGASDDLYAWAAARVAREPEVSAAGLLNEMATYGLGELAKEASDLLEQLEGHKAGSSQFQVHATTWDGQGPGHGGVTIDGQRWRLIDYKEEIPMTEELAGILQAADPTVEKRQCVTLTLAAGIHRHQTGSLPTFHQAVEKAKELRLEQARQAAEAGRTVGEPNEFVSAVEHETRVYIHDIVTPNHEKDFRSLAIFPLQDLADGRVIVLRADYQGQLIVEGITGPHWTSGGWTLFALIWKGHMTLLEPPAAVDVDQFLDAHQAQCTPALGFTFCWHSRHDQTATAPGKVYCRLCKGARKAGESPAVCRRFSCLAAVATTAGAKPGVAFLVRQLRPAGAQFEEGALVLQEIFAGTGRITAAWAKRYPALTPVEVFAEPHKKQGYKPDHDLLKPEVQQRVLEQARHGQANVWWIAAPCTSYCDWQIENGGTRTFEQPEGTGQGPFAAREDDGNKLSTFAATVFEEVLDTGGFPICESSAASGRYPKQWDLPVWKQVLARPDVEYVEFPMCAFGLGPPGSEKEFYVHRTRVVFPRHEPLRQVLLRICPGVSAIHKHVALKGARVGQQVTRCTEAGAYAWDFVTTVVAALHSSLGGGWSFATVALRSCACWRKKRKISRS